MKTFATLPQSRADTRVMEKIEMSMKMEGMIKDIQRELERGNSLIIGDGQKTISEIKSVLNVANYDTLEQNVKIRCKGVKEKI